MITFLIRSEEHTSELQSRFDLVCRLLLEKKKTYKYVFDFIHSNIIYIFTLTFLFYLYTLFFLFFSTLPLPPCSIFFPYTTLFRSPFYRTFILLCKRFSSSILLIK